MTDRDCANCKHHTEDGCSSWDCEYEPTDLISRADAMRLVHSAIKAEIPFAIVADLIKGLPSAEAVQGEWEHLSIKSISRSGVDELQELQCSNCGKWVTTPYMYYPSYHKFCPCCGAMMSNSNEGVDMRGGDSE